MWDELKHIKSGTNELREFGLTIGAILVILGDIALWNGKAIALYLCIAGLALILPGLLAPRVLKPIQKLWMALGLVLGFFVNRIVLAVLFYGVMTPIGLCAKLFGKDLLDARIDKKKYSYWISRSAAARPKKDYENQY